MAFNITIRNSNEAVNASVQKDNILPARYIKAIIYGAPGSGKTHLFGTANDHKLTGKILIADVDGGSLTLEGKNVDFTDIHEYTDIQNLYEFLVKYTTWRDVYLTAEDEDMKKKAKGQIAFLFNVSGQAEYDAFEVPIIFSVAIDTVTELQKKNMKTIMERVVEEHPERDPDVPSVREWGISGNQMRDIIKHFKSLNMHVFYSLHSRIDKDDNLGTVMQLPSLPGKLGPEVPGYVDIVGNLVAWVDKETKEFRNALYTQPYGQHITLKDRTGAIGAGMEMPTIPKIFDAIENKRKHLAKTMDAPKDLQIHKPEAEPANDPSAEDNKHELPFDE